MSGAVIGPCLETRDFLMLDLRASGRITRWSELRARASSCLLLAGRSVTKTRSGHTSSDDPQAVDRHGTGCGTIRHRRAAAVCGSRCSSSALEPIHPPMIWLFERPHERPRETLSVESGYDNVSGEYLVTRRRPDGECF